MPCFRVFKETYLSGLMRKDVHGSHFLMSVDVTKLYSGMDTNTLADCSVNPRAVEDNNTHDHWRYVIKLNYFVKYLAVLFLSAKVFPQYIYATVVAQSR